MGAQIGIELSPAACRIVELDVPRRFGSTPMTSVVRAEVLPPAGAETAAALAALRGRGVSVVVWGAPGDHRQVMVTSGRYEAMRAEAICSLALVGVDTRGTLVDIARVPISGEPASHPVGKQKRRAVVVALANSGTIGAALSLLLEAGIRVNTVATPAMALMSLSRLRHAIAGTSASNSVHAFIALEEDQTCIAILRSGTLVAARELPWGFRNGHESTRTQQEVATQLGAELLDFLTTVGGTPQILTQIVLCGGSPALRSVAALLTEQLDVEVEPLDTTFGIDTEQLTESVDGFSARVAGLRMAWAVAADARAPLNLTHARQRRMTETRVARVAVAAGLVAGMGLGWRIAESPLLWWSTSSTAATTIHTIPSIPVPKPAPESDLNFDENGN